ncbi:MAG: ACP S-malonyltransferase [Proteobacteria bacterium]|nr:ACP S-malonyltransferase [Pseudomonadota bacterium]MBS0462906.1 ACP S-malonyltransferase [Pseudomonadota bacterium]MBS0463551.1 ACP S-malonyltransferase [Pseudomonadota bacterium]
MSDSATSSSLAFVFPGQGSQAVGMLAELAAVHPQVRAAFTEASTGAGIDLWRLSQEGPETELNRTEFTQPALLAAGIGVWRAWLAAGGTRPVLLAGHSLGEYTALVAAGVLSLHDAAGLVRERGRLMQEAVPVGVGAMAAVLGADDELIAEICEQVAGAEVVAPANFNSPGQTVIAGHAAAVDRALAKLAQSGVRKAVKLPVSVPSHTALMHGAAERLAARMATIGWSAPSIPVVHNADVRSHDDPAAIRDALTRQLHQPVQWTGCVQELRDRGATRVIECGPGKVLAGLIKRIDRSLDARAIGTPADFDTALKDFHA